MTASVTRPRRTAVEILPREALAFDAGASIPGIVDTFRVDSRSMPGEWRTVEFRYDTGAWSCDCPAGEAGRRCSHVATAEYYGRYDRTLGWLRRLDLDDLIELDRRMTQTGRGILVGRLAVDVDRDALGDVIAERLAGQVPVTRSGVPVAQAATELFG